MDLDRRPMDLASMLGRYSFDFDESADDEGGTTTFSSSAAGGQRKAPPSSSAATFASLPRGLGLPADQLHQLQQRETKHHSLVGHGHAVPPLSLRPLPPPRLRQGSLTSAPSVTGTGAAVITASASTSVPARGCRVTATYRRILLTPFALKFFHRSPPVKSLWVMALVVCTAVSGFHFWRLLTAFNAGHTVLAPGRPQPFVFPDVTFCPPSAFFRRDVGKPDTLAGSNKTFGFDILLNSAPALWRYVLFGNMSLQRLTQSQREYASRLALQSIFRYYINSSAVLSPLDLVAYCRYQGRLCAMDNFSIFFHPAHGSCVTFHPPVRNVRATYLDHDSPGLVLQLHTLSPRDWLLTGDSQASMTHRHSYTVTLHPPMTWPTFDRVSHVNSGRITSMRVAMRQIWRTRLDEDDLDSSLASAAGRQSASFAGQLASASYCFGGQQRWCRLYASRLADRLLTLRQQELLTSCGCLSDSLPIPEALRDRESCVGVREAILLLFDPKRVKHVGRYLYILDGKGDMRWIEDTTGYAAFKRAVDCFLKKFPEPVDEARLSGAAPDPVTLTYRAQVDSGPWFQSTDTLQAAYISRNLRLYEEVVVQPEARRRNASLPVQAYLRRQQEIPQSIHAHQVLQGTTGMLEVRPESLLGRQFSEVWLYPLSMFLADAGGALGLLLGASLISLLESLDALLLLCSGGSGSCGCCPRSGDPSTFVSSEVSGEGGAAKTRHHHRHRRRRHICRQCEATGHLTC